MKLIIAGGRDFDNYELLLNSVLHFIASWGLDVKIVSGKAKGADTLGERFAAEAGFPIIEFPANWKEHGPSAGPIRNREMAKNADACICFWDGRSRGTKHMIDTAKEFGLKLKVVKYKAI